MKMLVTDLDGTLALAGKVSDEAKACLIALGEKRIFRVVATGRSLAGTRKVLADDFPIDYLIFSSGAGVYDWQRRELLRSHHLTSAEIARVAEVLKGEGLNFMLHHPIPDNHRFFYFDGDAPHEDHERRKVKHAEICSPWDGNAPDIASQFLVVCHAEVGDAKWTSLSESLGAFNVIRATSPLDGVSTWLEIFSRQVSKSLAASWLADRLGISRQNVLAIGNDYNDEDLLAWAGTAFLVEDAVKALHGKFPFVGSCAAGGFCEAVARWLLPR